MSSFSVDENHSVERPSCFLAFFSHCKFFVLAMFTDEGLFVNLRKKTELAPILSEVQSHSSE